MQLNLPYLSTLRVMLAVAALFLAFAGSTFAQDGIPGEPKKEPLGPMEEEMRIKRLISYAQKAHQENLNRAEKLCSLGTEIGTAFKQKNHLDRDDLKKLDKLEKLAKSIRSAAGGSDDPTDIAKLPTDLPSVVSKMEELAESLQDEVKKTPRRVISTAVIDQANVLLEVIRRARGLSAKPNS